MFYKHINGSLRTESILKCDTLDILDAFQKFVKRNVTLFVASDLCTDAVICYRTIHNVVIMQSPAIGFCTMVIDEMCPFLRIILKPLDL